jgi:hypothetical protein
MNSLIMTVLLVVMQASMPVPRQAPDNQAHTNHNSQKKSADNQRPSAPLPVPLPVDSKIEKDTGKSQGNTNTQNTVVIREPVSVMVAESWWSVVYVIATVALVLVGAIGIWFARRTLRAVEEQSRAAVIGATAANLNAQAVINSERAWILIDRGELADRIQEPYLVDSTKFAMVERMSHCIFFLKNFGKTPGRMTMLACELQIGNGRDRPPSTQVYETTGDFPPLMLAPGEPRAIEARGLVGFNDINISRLNNNRNPAFLWLCGVIKYEDVFNGVASGHKTNFCFLWETFMSGKPFWRWAGPNEYNEAT